MRCSEQKGLKKRENRVWADRTCAGQANLASASFRGDCWVELFHLSLMGNLHWISLHGEGRGGDRSTESFRINSTWTSCLRWKEIQEMENCAGELDCDLTFIYRPGNINLVLDVCCHCSWQIKILEEKNLKKTIAAFW